MKSANSVKFGRNFCAKILMCFTALNDVSHCVKLIDVYLTQEDLISPECEMDLASKILTLLLYIYPKYGRFQEVWLYIMIRDSREKEGSSI